MEGSQSIKSGAAIRDTMISVRTSKTYGDSRRVHFNRSTDALMYGSSDTNFDFNEMDNEEDYLVTSTNVTSTKSDHGKADAEVSLFTDSRRNVLWIVVSRISKYQIMDM